MSFRHGKDTAVAVSGWDITEYLNEADVSRSIDTAETTHFRGQAKTYIVGEGDGTGSVKGLFDGDPGGIDEASTAILALNIAEGIIPITVAQDGGFIPGRTVSVCRGKVTGWEVDAPVSDVVSVSGDFQSTGGIRRGKCLQGETPLSATTNGASVDGGADASTGPLSVYAHVNNLRDGDVTVIVQHSDDGTTWTDFVTLPTVPASGRLGQYAVSVGTTKRYVRAKTTVAGTSGSVMAIVSVARS